MQCFTYNGWKAWGNTDGDISPRESEQFSISWKDFERLVLPKLTPADTVIFLSLSSPSHHHADSSSSEYFEYVDSLAHKVHEKGVALFAVEIKHQQQEREKGDDENSHHPAVLSSSLVRHLATFELPFLYILDGVPAFAEIALKWVLNSLTTSAHILAGKVFKNRMIGTLPLIFPFRTSFSFFVFRS